MLGINATVDKISSLIEARQNSRSIQQLPHSSNSPLRMIGESLLNRFASGISETAILAEQQENIQEELIENIISSFALAGMLGIDLEKNLAGLIDILDAVSAEAS